MKTAKKLFSLLLVAVLLFSALPFQAFASEEGTEEEPAAFTVQFNYNGQKDTVAIPNGSNISGVPTEAAKAAAPEGKQLDGWSLSNGGAKVDVTSLKATADLTGKGGVIRLYAIYTDIPHECDYTASTTVVDPSCKNQGYTRHFCECGKYIDDTYTATVAHAWGDPVENPATDTSEGSITKTCTVCGAVDTQVQGQLGTEVQFVDIEGGRDTQTRSWKKGANISSSNIPTLNDLNGRKFVGWYTRNAGGGYKFDGGIWNPGNDNYATVYYARYEDSNYANYASVTVYANVYNGSRLVDRVKLSNEIPFTVGEYILDDLMDRREHFLNTFFDNSGYSAADYEVADQAFYMNTTDAKITDGTTLARGNTSVYIKIKAKGSAAAPVQLFVHTKVESGYVAHYDVPGFIAGEEITLSYIKNFLQSKTGKTYNITAMHDQQDWDRMLAGFTCESNTVLEVAENGLRIHIVAPSYTSSSSTSSKPASNPATGDNSMLEITAATMLLAAAAVVTLTQLRKRKMI